MPPSAAAAPRALCGRPTPRAPGDGRRVAQDRGRGRVAPPGAECAWSGAENGMQRSNSLGKFIGEAGVRTSVKVITASHARLSVATTGPLSMPAGVRGCCVSGTRGIMCDAMRKRTERRGKKRNSTSNARKQGQPGTRGSGVADNPLGCPWVVSKRFFRVSGFGFRVWGSACSRSSACASKLCPRRRR